MGEISRFAGQPQVALDLPQIAAKGAGSGDDRPGHGHRFQDGTRIGSLKRRHDDRRPCQPRADVLDISRKGHARIGRRMR